MRSAGASRPGRITAADEGHLAAVGSIWSTNYGLEFGLESRPAARDVAAALAAACALAPRLCSRARGRRWVPGPVPVVEEVEDSRAALHDLRTSFVDEQFDPRADAPLRVAVSGSRIVLACMHAVCDTPGLVGFASHLFTALSATTAPEHRTRAWPMLHREAWRPAVFRELVELRRRPAAHLTPFPATGAPVIGSDAAVWSLTASETEAVLTAAGRTGPMGITASTLLNHCLGQDRGGAFATLFIPANLRPREQPWWPAGNHIGHLLLDFDAPVAAAELAATIRRRLETARYAARWESLAARARNRGRHDPGPGTPELEQPPISINVNNLGRIDESLLPGVTDMVFLGSNSPLYPVVTLLTLGSRMSVCARVREHHGGRAVAETLIDQVRRELL